MKGMAREFTSAMNDAADEAGVKDVAKTMRAATNPIKTGLDKVGETTKEFTNFDPLSETGKLASRGRMHQKIREVTAKRQNDKKVSTAVTKSEKNNKSRPKKKSKSESKK